MEKYFGYVILIPFIGLIILAFKVDTFIEYIKGVKDISSFFLYFFLSHVAIGPIVTIIIFYFNK